MREGTPSGASAHADRAGGPADLSRSSASQPEALIPCAIEAIFEVIGFVIRALVVAFAVTLSAPFMLLGWLLYRAGLIE